MFNTPILLLIFNRPEQTQQVFDAIRQLQPRYLYIASDGPRTNNKNDIILCNQCKAIVSKVDWNCEIKTLFRDKNLGCGVAPATGISWFFDQVDEGIILEDDCVPNGSFFEFCETLLAKYRTTLNVMMICGTSYQPQPLNSDTYYFSKYPHAWGWATWKRAWLHYNFKLDDEPVATQVSIIKNTFTNRRERKLWKFNMGLIIKGLDAWDYQWMYWIWKNDGLCIVPWQNMISNIGFGSHATHTLDVSSVQSRMAQHEIAHIQHPKVIAVNKKADQYERYNILIDQPSKYYKQRFSSVIKRFSRLIGFASNN